MFDFKGSNPQLELTGPVVLKITSPAGKGLVFFNKKYAYFLVFIC
jgi:hypothetical protein